jgi:hypothetical protein
MFRKNGGAHTKIPDRYIRRAQSWHWGIPAKRVVDWQDPSIPPILIEIGQLCELHVKPIDGGPIVIMSIPEADWPACHVAFDPDHASQRIYILIPQAYQREMRPTYVPKLARPLFECAQAIGGRHARRNDYPRLQVTPLGVLTHVVYFTHKKGDENPGDDRSQYIHEMGEEGGIPPALCVDASGRLWVAGGSYTCPIPGITH